MKYASHYRSATVTVEPRDVQLSLDSTAGCAGGRRASCRYRLVTAEPLSLQIVRQLQEAIETGSVAGGTQLPSTRLLARTLGVSRNTLLTAYDELAA